MKYSEIKKRHINNKKKRPGNKITPRFITIHNTGNPKSTASNERAYLDNPSNINSTGWHLVIDELQCIEAIPLDEIAYHAGDKKGNRTSIGIEVCEKGDFNKTLKHTAELVADLLVRFDMDINCVVKHKDWSGKQCPRLIIPMWDEFIKMIKEELDNMVESAKIKVMNNGNIVEVESIQLEGTNYIKLRDLPKLANVVVGYDANKKMPIIQEGGR